MAGEDQVDRGQNSYISYAQKVLGDTKNDLHQEVFCMRLTFHDIDNILGNKRFSSTVSVQYKDNYKN